MCKVVDAAMTMVNHSIDVAKKTGDRRYLVNFYKLHKLLYYAQGYMLSRYGKGIFEEEIEAHKCGPFINELLSMPCGYDDIETKFPDEDVFPLTQDRIDAIDYAIKEYGSYTKDELVNKSKGDQIYLDFLNPATEKTIIPKDAFRNYSDIFWHKGQESQ